MPIVCECVWKVDVDGRLLCVEMGKCDKAVKFFEESVALKSLT